MHDLEDFYDESSENEMMSADHRVEQRPTLKNA